MRFAASPVVDEVDAVRVIREVAARPVPVPVRESSGLGRRTGVAPVAREDVAPGGRDPAPVAVRVNDGVTLLDRERVIAGFAPGTALAVELAVRVRRVPFDVDGVRNRRAFCDAVRVRPVPTIEEEGSRSIRLIVPV